MDSRTLRKIERARLVSFDIFDTLIERDTDNPDDIFVRVGEAILGPGKGAEFRAMRKEAERKARAATPPYGEVNLEEIYSQLGTNAELRPELHSELLREECAQEIASVHAKTQGIELLQAAQRAGKTVVLTSDMYLSRETITAMLNKCGIWSNDDRSDETVLGRYNRLYISNEERCGKRNKLFDIVLQNADIKPTEALHFGDNLKSDFLSPIRKGMRAVWLPQRNWFWKKIKSVIWK